MKRFFNWQILLGLSFIALSAIFYLIHYVIFKDTHHIFIFLIGDIAFVPIEVLLVTLIIHRLLGAREKRVMLEKLNMIIGAFFCEVGTKLLEYFSDCDPHCDKIRKELIVAKDWSEQKFFSVSKDLKNYDYRIESQKVDLDDLKSFLTGKRNFLVNLLANPNLLEHESFTVLLQAVFHLTEELDCRENVRPLPDADYAHLSSDMQKAYALLVSEWLVYMKHLCKEYPYLFSLAMRINPFDPNASPEIKE